MLVTHYARRRAVVVALALVVLSIFCLGVAAWAGDPSGSTTGGKADVVGATAGAPTAADLKAAEKTEPFAVKLADVEGQNRVAINLVWLLVTGFLVMFMQAG